MKSGRTPSPDVRTQQSPPPLGAPPRWTTSSPSRSRTSATSTASSPPGSACRCTPFQEVGALAVAAGHTGLFDEPRVGKTRTSLTAATLLRSHRTLIISPPLVVTNWARTAEESQLATRGGKTDGKVAVFRSGRK